MGRHRTGRVRSVRIEIADHAVLLDLDAARAAGCADSIEPSRLQSRHLAALDLTATEAEWRALDEMLKDCPR